MLKTATALFSLWFIYKRVIEKNQFHAFLDFIKQKSQSSETLIALSGVIVLMFANWGIEAVKWRMVVKQLWPISLKDSIRAVFTGATISFFTPNRIGDFAGRILFLPPQVRLPSVLSTFVSNLSQLTITLSMGLFCSSVFLENYFRWSKDVLLLTKIVAGIFGMALLILFPAIRFIAYTPLLQKLKKKYAEYVSLLENYTSRQLAAVLLLSFFRYSVFSIQYLILFSIMGIPFSATLVALVCIIFFVQAVIPTVAITEFAFRGSVAIFVTAPFISSDNEIITASFALWLINLALPAAIGSLMIFYSKFQNQNS